MRLSAPKKDTEGKVVVVGLGVSFFVSWPRPSTHCFTKLPMILLEPPQTDSEVMCMFELVQ